MKYFNLIICSILILFCSCNSSQNELSNSLSTDFSELKVLIDTFEIAPNQITRYSTNDGTMIFIPSNSLTYEDGSLVKEKVTVTFQYFDSLQDIILGGLTTISDDNLLISEGMFNLQASVSSNKTINIKDPWRVEVKSLKKESKVFEGKIIADGNINWVNPSERDYRLVPLPFDSLWEMSCIYDCLGTCMRKTLSSIPNDMALFQNTWLATREFWGLNPGFCSNRNYAIGSINEALISNSYLRTYNYPYNFSHAEKQSSDIILNSLFIPKKYRYDTTEARLIQNHILSIYLDHLELPLFQMRPIIVERTKMKLKEITKKDYIIDYQDARIYPKGSSVYKQVHHRMQNYLEEIATPSTNFSKCFNTKYTTIDTRFLLTVDSVAIRQLKQNYIDSTESIEYRIRKKNNETRNFARSTLGAIIPSWGWYNVDYFLKDKFKDLLFSENVTVKIADNRIRQVFVLVDKENIVIKLNKTQDNQFKMLEGKFPQKKVKIIAIGWDDKQNIFYGSLDTSIKTTNFFEIKTKVCKPALFKEILENILQS